MDYTLRRSASVKTNQCNFMDEKQYADSPDEEEEEEKEDDKKEDEEEEEEEIDLEAE